MKLGKRDWISFFRWILVWGVLILLIDTFGSSEIARDINGDCVLYHDLSGFLILIPKWTHLIVPILLALSIVLVKKEQNQMTEKLNQTECKTKRMAEERISEGVFYIPFSAAAIGVVSSFAFSWLGMHFLQAAAVMILSVMFGFIPLSSRKVPDSITCNEWIIAVSGILCLSIMSAILFAGFAGITLAVSLILAIYVISILDVLAVAVVIVAGYIAYLIIKGVGSWLNCSGEETKS